MNNFRTVILGLILVTNLSGARGRSPLILAAQRGDLVAVTKYIRNGDDVNFFDKDNRTALMVIAMSRRCIKNTPSVISELTAKGADVNLQDSKGRTALMLAALRNNEEIVEILIQQKANVDLVDHDGKTALMLASYHACLATATKLITRGADLNLRDTKEKTALMLASEKGYGRIVKELIHKGAIELIDRQNKTALMLASEKGYGHIVKELIDKGAALNRKDEQGKTALMLASEKGYGHIVKEIIDKGAELSLKDNQGKTALMLASRKDIQKMIIIGYVQKLQFTPIIVAAWLGYTDIVIERIQAGDDTNEKIPFGSAILLNKCIPSEEANSSKKLARLESYLSCLRASQKSLILDKYGSNRAHKSALTLALLAGHMDVVKAIFIAEGQKRGKTGLIYAIENWNTLENECGTLMHDLIQNVANPNEKDNNDKTVLMYASEKGCLDVVKLLIAKEADVGKFDSNKKTALMYASEKGHADVIALLAGKAFVDAYDNSEKTALMYASEQWKWDAVQALIGSGADVNFRNNRYLKTALMYAAEKGHMHNVEILINHGADVDATDKNGKTALRLALENQISLEIAKELASVAKKFDPASFNLVKQKAESGIKAYKEIVEIMEKKSSEDMRRYYF
ncbi:MAG: ankyrin repeat domain-containing protein [Alphaproteobacteria bacterium]|nr:MAG: ankyrin repeat domain-containing protein [Alphaproteobacteria bacterium]